MREYVKPELSVEALVADTTIAGPVYDPLDFSDETVISGGDAGDNWLEWDE